MQELLKNPLDELGIQREHLIALHEAVTHTNKKTSGRRAQYLLDLFKRLKVSDEQRSQLHWDEDVV